MKCDCGNELQTVESRTTRPDNTTYRKRYCRKCNLCYETEERIIHTYREEMKDGKEES